MEDGNVLAEIARAASGDAEALQLLLVRRHAVLLARVAAGLPSSVARHIDADDILQEAYARAFRAITSCTFDSPAAFHAWLDQIVSNVLCDQRRFLHRKKRDINRDRYATIQPSDSRTQFFDRLRARDSTPSRVFAHVEASAAVTSSLARLTEEQREVVCLRFLEGWSVPEVASRMNRSEAAIHALCYRALKSLREVLGTLSRHLPTQ